MGISQVLTRERFFTPSDVREYLEGVLQSIVRNIAHPHYRVRLSLVEATVCRESIFLFDRRSTLL